MGIRHPDTTSSINNLASLYLVIQQYKDAESLYLRALKINQQQFGAEGLEIIPSLNNLASLYKLLQRYEEAEPLYTKAIAICQQHLGADCPYLAQGLDNLA